jgi:type IV secretion system protein VirD4
MAGVVTDVGLIAYKGLKKTRKKLATSKLGSKKDMGRLTGIDGLILSKELQLSFNKTLEGTCVIAPTGEGKTTSIFMPNLLSNYLPKSSIVITDPKKEMWNLTSEYQRSIGRTPILLEILGDEGHYNPLTECSNFTEIKDLASNLLQNGELAIQLASGRTGGESTWINSAIPLWCATLLMCKTISGALKVLINTPSLELANMFENCGNEDALEQFRIFQSSNGSPKTMSSIVSTLLSSLQLFTDHNIIKTTSKSDFKPSDLREHPIALYIVYDEAKANYLSPFLSVFYTQLIDKIMYSEGLPVLFFLDEAQNIGRISNLSQTVAVGRSRGLGFILCLQNLVRLYDVYGKNNTTTILNCLKTKCILPSLSDFEALTYLSNLCGDTQITTTSTSDQKTSHSETTRKLFTPDEIRRIGDDKVLIIPHNKLPFLDDQNTYYTQKRYTDNVREVKI